MLEKKNGYMEDKERWNLLASVANLYYNSYMTQSEISKRLYISRPKVSRLLKEAKEKGVVKITISEPWDRNLELEAELERRFQSLEDIRIVTINENDVGTVLQKLGEISAYYLDTVISKDTILGISWGNTLYHIVKTIKTNKNIPLTVVPIMGAASISKPERDSLDLAKDLAESYGGKYNYIYAPLFVKSRELKESLVQDDKIGAVLKIGKSANLILTSVGSIACKTWQNYLPVSSLDILSSRGAIGHIGGHFYDKYGKEVSTSLKDRMIGIDLDDFKKSPKVICVAGREEKSLAVLGAIRGGFINTLITDESCALKIIELDDEHLCN